MSTAAPGHSFSSAANRRVKPSPACLAFHLLTPQTAHHIKILIRELAVEGVPSVRGAGGVSSRDFSMPDGAKYFTSGYQTIVSLYETRARAGLQGIHWKWRHRSRPGAPVRDLSGGEQPPRQAVDLWRGRGEHRHSLIPHGLTPLKL
jgi:hypothetical protein